TQEEMEANEHWKSSREAETFQFNADIAQLMRVRKKKNKNVCMNNKKKRMYNQKKMIRITKKTHTYEIFLRELISNASDALDKIRYVSRPNPEVLEKEKKLKNEIIPDPDEKVLIIRNAGIGMTKEDLVNNIGTIARSGTKQFIEIISAGADISTIGQFGVGFYSAYLANERVVVRSKHNEDEQHVWKIIASGTFRVRDDIDNPYQIKRGTEIYLHLKDDCANFCKKKNVKKLVKKYSRFVAFQISLLTIKEEEKVLYLCFICFEVNKEEVKVSNDKEKKKIKEKKEKLELLNKQKQIWTRKLEEVSKEEYTAFYKSICNDCEEHLAVKHFSADGQLEFSGLLFVPKKALLFEPTKKKKNIKLFVQRVFIIDGCKDLCTECLSFIRGVVKSEDLPLKSLQQNMILKIIQKNIVNKCLELFGEIVENKADFKVFYEQFHKNLKLWINEDAKNRNKLADLLKYHSTKSSEELKSLKEYVKGLDLPLTEEEKEQKDEKVILVDNVEKIMVSCRMVESTCPLVTGEYGWSANMERIMKMISFKMKMTQKMYQKNKKRTNQTLQQKMLTWKRKKSMQWKKLINLCCRGSKEIVSLCFTNAFFNFYFKLDIFEMNTFNHWFAKKTIHFY
ncbi:heat shock protein 90, partial [Reticulomyxa filosa]